jgi:hypothetical protein
MRLPFPQSRPQSRRAAVHRPDGENLLGLVRMTIALGDGYHVMRRAAELGINPATALA